MEAVLIIMALTLLAILAFSVETGSSSKLSRGKMKESILEIEKILNLDNNHHEIELDRMSDQDLTVLYNDLGEKFDLYIHERNAKNNKNALEDF